jgi:hypothetical protein
VKKPEALQWIANAVAKRASARATSSAMKDAREGNWARMELMVQKTGAEPLFDGWADAYSAMLVWANKAPLRLSGALADTRVSVQTPGGSLQSGWWPPPLRKARDASEDVMAMRLGLLIRGAAWRAASERSDAPTEALRARLEASFHEASVLEAAAAASRGSAKASAAGAADVAAEGWAAQALADLFEPRATDADAAQNAARIAGSAMAGSVSMLWLVGEETGGRVAPVGLDLKEEALREFAARVEAALAEAIGDHFARANRGAALGGLWAAANGCRPSMGMEEARLRSLNLSSDEKWAQVLAGVAESQREACLREALLTEVMDGEPMRPDRPIVSEQKARAALSMASRAWGERGAARAWPEDVQAGAFGELARAKKAAIAIEDALAEAGGAGDARAENAPKAGEPSGSTSDGERPKMKGLRL